MTVSLHLTLLAEKRELRRLSDLQLTALFENRGKKPLSAVINATPLSHGRYEVEFQDSEGRAPNLHHFGKCGTMSPLLDHEIFDVAPGTVHRVPVYGGQGADLPPGAYRVRVTYEAYPSDHGKESWTPVVKERLKYLWTGTLVSDWVPFTIRPTS